MLKEKTTVDEAVSLVKQSGSAKFDETIDLASRLSVNPAVAEQNIRGTVSLPHGTGKSVRVVVFAEGDKAREAEEAGADFVGTDDIVDKIVDGWLEFDATIATPDLMRSIMPKLGRVLGPRGLMPNPKAGTVTTSRQDKLNIVLNAHRVLFMCQLVKSRLKKLKLRITLRQLWMLL